MPMATLVVLVLEDACVEALDFDCPWKNFPVYTKSMTISSPGQDSERFFVYLCLSGVWQFGVWQLKHLHLQLTDSRYIFFLPIAL
jgi:hypothetical protein